MVQTQAITQNNLPPHDIISSYNLLWNTNPEMFMLDIYDTLPMKAQVRIVPMKSRRLTERFTEHFLRRVPRICAVIFGRLYKGTFAPHERLEGFFNIKVRYWYVLKQN